MAYKQDPGGQFKTVAHRQLLAHLSHPDDTYGWGPDALPVRVYPDFTPAEAASLLADLIADGLAEPMGRMTRKGFDMLTAPAHIDPDRLMPGPVQISNQHVREGTYE